MADLENYNIEKFYTALINREMARQHQFRITHIEPGFAPDVVEGIDDIETKLYVERTTLPGRSITNNAVNYHGIDFNLPGNAKYTGSEAWGVTFRMDQNLNIRRMFEDWSFAIFNDRKASGSITRSNESYMTMTQFDQQGDFTSQYTFWGIYPVTVGELEYNIGTDGAPVTMQVTFAYHYWSRVNRTNRQVTESPAKNAETSQDDSEKVVADGLGGQAGGFDAA